jgi:hypothetical protein
VPLLWLGLTVSLALLLMAGARVAYWLLVGMIALEAYVVWVLQDPNGMALSEATVLGLSAMQLVALLTRSVRAYVRGEKGASTHIPADAA